MPNSPTDQHVLHVFSSGGMYGAEHVVLGLIPALSRLGIASTLACIDNPYLGQQPLFERACELGIDAARVPCSGRLDSTTTHALRRLVARHPGTILHVHGYKSAFYAMRARRGHPEVPLVSTVHGWITNTRALWLYRMLELWMLRRVQSICIVSERMRKPLLDAGVAADRIHLVENGIDTERFRTGIPAAQRTDFSIPQDAFVFGAIQRLSQEKNPLGLIEAFADVAGSAPHAWMVVAGDGPLRAAIEQRAHELGVAGRVRMLGVRDDPERLYALFDCYVLPSLSEGLPLALLEAMACELPVIASAVGQIPSVLQGLPGQLVAPGDRDALASAMRKALAGRPPIAAMRERVLAQYSVTRMAKEYAELYRNVGGNRATRAA